MMQKQLIRYHCETKKSVVIHSQNLQDVNKIKVYRKFLGVSTVKNKLFGNNEFLVNCCTIICGFKHQCI